MRRVPLDLHYGTAGSFSFNSIPKTMRSPWTEEAVRSLFDDTLYRCASQLRYALTVIDRKCAVSDNRYVEEMRRGLRLMEAEIRRRGRAMSSPLALHQVTASTRRKRVLYAQAMAASEP